MELLRITRQIHRKAVEQRATLIHRQYNRDWGTSYSRPPIDPYLTSPPVTKSWRRHWIGGECSSPLCVRYSVHVRRWTTRWAAAVCRRGTRTSCMRSTRASGTELCGHRTSALLELPAACRTRTATTSDPSWYGTDSGPEPKKRAWRHGRAWKMKTRAWKNQDPCFNFYKHIYALLHKYPV